MAEVDPVEIVVDIVDNFSDDLKKFKAQLEKLDQEDIDIRANVDDDGDIESVRAQLEALREVINAAVDIDVIGEEKAMAIKQALSRDMRSTLHIDTDHGPLTPSTEVARARDEMRDMNLRVLGERMEGIPSLGRSEGSGRFLEDMVDTDNAAQDFTNSIQNALASSRKLHGDDGEALFGDFLAQERFQPRMFDEMFGRGRGLDFGADFGEMGDVMDFGGRHARRLGIMEQIAEAVGSTDRRFTRLGKTLLKYRPSIMDWWNLLALMIPIMITLVGAAIGLAAALGAVATAAVGILGVGLLGWGENAQQMMTNLQKEAKQLGAELFAVFKPVGDTFQPIVEDWIEGAPQQLAILRDEMKDFVDFQEPLSRMGTGIVEWIEEVLQAMHALGGEASQVLLRMGGAFGNFLIDALSAMLLEVHENQDAYIELAEILLGVVVSIFNVAKSITFIVAQFGFLIDALVFLTSLLDNDFIVILGTMLTTAYLLGFAFESLGVIMAAVANGAIAGYIGKVVSAVAATWQWVWATNALASSLLRLAAVTGAGLLIAGAGLAAAESLSPPSGGRGAGFGSGSRSGGAPGGSTTNITINGDVREREMDRVLDEIGPGSRNEMNMQERMN